MRLFTLNLSFILLLSFIPTNNQSFAIQQKLDVNASDRSGTTVLMKAAIGNKLTEVKALITNGANLDAVDNDGRTALIWAVTVNNIELVKTLLDAGADFSLKDKKGNLAVMYAHTVGFKEIANLLRKAEDKFGRNSLVKAVAFDDKPEVLTLLSYGFNINSIDSYGFTPLMHASTGGNKQMVLLLLSNGANPSSIANNGKTAASLAFDCDHAEIVEVLEQRTKNNKNKPIVSFTDSDATSIKTSKNAGSNISPTNNNTNVDDKDPLKTEYRKLVTAFFDTQKQGLSSDEFFCDKELAKSLFNVTSFEIVNEKVELGEGRFIVKVDSSNKGGQAIRVLWRVETKSQGGIYCIYILTQATS